MGSNPITSAKFMNEENRRFSSILALLAKQATQEAFIRARKTLDNAGITIVQDGYLIRLLPDNSVEIIRKINHDK